MITGAVQVALAAAATFTSSVYVDRLQYNVLGMKYKDWRVLPSGGFNPTNDKPPFIQSFDPSFLDITGPSATIRKIASNKLFNFANEAPVFVPDLNVVFFSNTGGGLLSDSGWFKSSTVSMVNMTEVDKALASATGDVNVKVQKIDFHDKVQMVNGATGPYKGDLLFVTSGPAKRPPTVVRVNPNPPYNETVLLDNFFGRQFNSLNDVQVLPGTDIIFFTDATYGFLAGWRPPPLMREQVYRFDPSTGDVRVVSDHNMHPNGIAFPPDGKIAYVTDTGSLSESPTFPATIYQYDVNPLTHTFENRRVFAYVDSGAPDGITIDSNGNVYAACGDGTHVWNPAGTLIGKFYVEDSTAQMIFTNSGLLILDGTALYLANIKARGMNLVTL